MWKTTIKQNLKYQKHFDQFVCLLPTTIMCHNIFCTSLINNTQQQVLLSLSGLFEIHVVNWNIQKKRLANNCWKNLHFFATKTFEFV